MRSKRFQLRAAVFAIVCGTLTAARAADTAWTAHDLDAVTDAAIEASKIADNVKSQRASMMTQLADALAKAGALARAKDVLLAASAILEPPKDFMTSAAWSHIVEDLARFGDDRDAERLSNIEAALPVKAGLIAGLGTGRAEAGDHGGALSAAQKIISLGPSNDPGFNNAATIGLKKIAFALIEKGALDDALRVGEGTSDKPASTQIVARVATALCRASKFDQGRNLAQRASIDTRAVAAAADKPGMMFAPIIGTAEAMTACEGLKEAQSFFESAVPSDMVDAMRASLIDQLARGGQAELAVAVTPPPRPGNAADLVNLADRLARQGDKAGAIKAASDAIQTIVQSAAPRLQQTGALVHVIDLLDGLDDYDDALTAATAVPPVSRDNFYVTIMLAAASIRMRPAWQGCCRSR